MLELHDLARLEEGRLALAMVDLAQASRRLEPAEGGGVFARGAPGTWTNLAVGMGLDGPVPDRVMDDLIDWFVPHGVEPRLELCPFADPTLITGLAKRSFVLRGFENVFFRTLDPTDTIRPLAAHPPEVSIVRVDQADDRRIMEWARTVSSGFAMGREPTEAEVELTAAMARHPRSVTFAALCDDRVVGGGSIEIFGTIGTLFALSTAPEYRRKGIQQAIIAARLNHAASVGVKVATISSRPGVATERNARRMGFQVGYTKVVLVRPGPGLVSMAS